MLVVPFMSWLPFPNRVIETTRTTGTSCRYRCPTGQPGTSGRHGPLLHGPSRAIVPYGLGRRVLRAWPSAWAQHYEPFFGPHRPVKHVKSNRPCRPMAQFFPPFLSPPLLPQPRRRRRVARRAPVAGGGSGAAAAGGAPATVRTGGDRRRGKYRQREEVR